MNLDTFILLAVLVGVVYLIFDKKRRDKSGSGGNTGGDNGTNDPK